MTSFAVPVLDQNDFLNAIGILGQALCADGPVASRKQALAAALARCIQADAWFWALTTIHCDKCQIVPARVIFDGLTDSRLAQLVEASPIAALAARNTPDSTDGHEASVYIFTRDTDCQHHDSRGRGGQLPATPRSDADFICAWSPFHDHGCCSLCQFLRNPGQRPFAPRDHAIVQHVMTSVPGLYQHDLPRSDNTDCLNTLSPRQRQVLLLLVDGRSRAEMAHLLHLSTHTVKDHIKAIYRRFSVNSQRELMRRFADGQLADGDGHQ